jgi:MoaA/NifB/PqqE/SkfB family radical SAM enzyme
MQPRSNRDMRGDDFRRIVDDLRAQEVFLLTLSGGEPFLHPQFAPLFEYAHERFKHVITLTNGTALRPAHFKAIRRVMDRKGGATVQVSLDSSNSSVNAQTRAPADRTMRAIRELADAGCQVMVAIVVTRHNLESVAETIEELSSFTRWFHIMTVQDIRGRDGIQHMLGADSDQQQELWSHLQQLAEQRNLFINLPSSRADTPTCATGAPCMAAFTHFVVDPDLTVRPCDRLTDVSLGSLADHSISEIWNGPAALAMLGGGTPRCRHGMVH